MEERLVPMGEEIKAIARLPLTPFWGWKKAQVPLFPAGHATTSLGPMTERLLPGRGLVTTT